MVIVISVAPAVTSAFTFAERPFGIFLNHAVTSVSFAIALKLSPVSVSFISCSVKAASVIPLIVTSSAMADAGAVAL